MKNDELHYLETENAALKLKNEQLYDDILSHCCDCCGYSSQSKAALQEVLACCRVCRLLQASKASLSVLWGIRTGHGMPR